MTANVDVRCAVRKTLLMSRARSLPVIGEAGAADHELFPRVLDKNGRPRAACTIPGVNKGQAPGNKGKRYPATPVTDGDVMLLLAGCSKTSPTGIRNAAWVALTYRSGLRVAETLALVEDDLDEEARTVLVQHGKGNKTRVAAMDEFGWRHLRPWLERRRKLGFGPDVPLFCTIARPAPGGPLDSKYCRELLHRLARQAGIRKRVTPHGLRHGMAHGMSQEGVPVPVISKALGHSNIGTTHTYLNHIDQSTLVGTVTLRPQPGAGA